MFTAYALYKFLHVLGAIGWVGGATTLSILFMRAVRTQDRAAISAVMGQSIFLGRVFFGPAALLALAAGIATAVTGDLDFGMFWITWGFIGISVACLIGAALSIVLARMRRRALATP